LQLNLKSTIKFSIVITGVAILTFISIVGLTKQEWVGTVFPEQAENKQSRIDDNKEEPTLKTDKIIEDSTGKLTEEILEKEIDKKELPKTVNFQGRTIKRGDIIRLYNVNFDLDKAELKPESYEELLNLIDLLINNPRLHVEISGHTSKTRSKEYSINLSRERAEAVFQYIIGYGVEENRLEVVGYGFENPISIENDSLDRRVEFKVLDI